jgi:hypothetical protein
MSEAVTGREDADTAGETLRQEIAALREALSRVMNDLEGDSKDSASLKQAAAVARLCDTIVRAVSAQKRLGTGNDDIDKLRSDFKRILRTLNERAQKRIADRQKRGA